MQNGGKAGWSNLAGRAGPRPGGRLSPAGALDGLLLPLTVSGRGRGLAQAPPRVPLPAGAAAG
jgi:hypothetical protein